MSLNKWISHSVVTATLPFLDLFLGETQKIPFKTFCSQKNYKTLFVLLESSDT